jgi:hypothetical protein
MADTVTIVTSNQPPPQKRRFQYQAMAWAPVPWPNPAFAIVNSNNPPPYIRVFQYQARAYPPVFAGAISADMWFQPWSLPATLTKKGIGKQLQDFAADFPQPFTPIMSGWYAPWRDPVRLKPGIRAQLQDFAADFPQAPTVLLSQWYAPWREPVRQKPGLHPRYQDFAADFPQSGAEVVTVDKWFQWWSQKPSPKWVTSETKFGFGAPDTSLGADYWYAPWPDFAKGRKFPTGEQQAFSWGYTTPAAEIITYDKWGFPWSEPVRQKLGLRAYLQKFAADFPQTTGEVVTVDKWFQWLSQRPAPKWNVSESSFDFVVPDQSLGANFWYAPWPDFAGKKTFPTRLQQAFAWGGFFPPAFDPKNLQYPPWSEPVRTKQGLLARLQTFFGYDPFPFTPVTQWLFPWTEPVRQKPGLKNYLQQTTAFAPLPVFNPVGFTSWYSPWRDPVRIRPGLLARLQRWLFEPDEKPPAVTITVTLNATEINTDEALFGINVYGASPAIPSQAGVKVSIMEVPVPFNTPTSIRES